MIKEILTLILVMSLISVSAQQRCGAEMITTKRMKNYSEYALARNKVDTETERWIKDYYSNNKNTVITIPVVVHVVWATNIQNISDAQIQSQIDILNRDYR